MPKDAKLAKKNSVFIQVSVYRYHGNYSYVVPADATAFQSSTKIARLTLLNEKLTLYFFVAIVVTDT